MTIERNGSDFVVPADLLADAFGLSETDIREAILDARHPPGLTLQSLRVQIPDEWSRQRESLLRGTE